MPHYVANNPSQLTRPSLWRLAQLIFSFFTVTACGGGSDSLPLCSSTKALVRFDIETAPTTASHPQLFSSGGFIEVYTRKSEFGPVDSYRICTAYVEFTDSPAESLAVLLNERLEMNVYTAAHCVDLAKDHSMKLHMFDHQSRTYYPVNVEYPLMNKIQALRTVMRDRKVSLDNQKKVLNSLRTNAANLNALFNAPTLTTTAAGSGASEVAGKICLKKDDPVFNNVCSTYQDMIHLKIEPAASTPLPVIERIKQLRADSTKTLSALISVSKLAAKFKANPSGRLFFADETQTPLDLIGVHKAARNRVQIYSKFKMLKHVLEDMPNVITACADDKNSWFCSIRDEFSELIQSALKGTKYESFSPSKLADVVNGMNSEIVISAQRMETLSTVFEVFMERRPDGSFFIPLDVMIHSNFRFVTLAEPTEDKPDPMNSTRAFMFSHANNLTGLASGVLNNFIQWIPMTKLGRFHHMQMHKEVTQDMRNQAAAMTAAGIPTVPHMGFLQAGDSGSIITVENLPYFAVTSVNGESTSGGASIRPLPQPIEEEPPSGSGKSPVKLCK